MRRKGRTTVRVVYRGGKNQDRPRPRFSNAGNAAELRGFLTVRGALLKWLPAQVAMRHSIYLDGAAGRGTVSPALRLSTCCGLYDNPTAENSFGPIVSYGVAAERPSAPKWLRTNALFGSLRFHSSHSWRRRASISEARWSPA